MSVSVRGHVIDERFLSHRLGSTSLAGIIGGLLSIFLFSLVFGAMVYLLIKSKNLESLDRLWEILPAFLLLSIFFWGYALYK